MTPDAKKKAAAETALAYVESGWVIGVGTGSTSSCNIPFSPQTS